jgi:hypothetical protein
MYRPLTKRNVAAALLIGAVLVFTSGCLRVVRQEAPYYVKGPHQVEPPDGFFTAGAKVIVLGEQDSYNRVLSFDGILAHVWNQDLISLSQWNQEQRLAGSTE